MKKTTTIRVFPLDSSASRLLPAYIMASNMAYRHTWEAAVARGNVLGKLSLNEQEIAQFQSEHPFLPFLKHLLLPNNTSVLEDPEMVQNHCHYLEEDVDVTVHFCTDAFATSALSKAGVSLHISPTKRRKCFCRVLLPSQNFATSRIKYHHAVPTQDFVIIAVVSTEQSSWLCLESTYA
jgi:hypothetical protein